MRARRWVLVLSGIGALAALWSLSGLFTGIDRTPLRGWSSPPPPVDSLSFVHAVAGAVNAPARAGGKAEILVNGVEFVPALLDALRGAERSINWMAYVWRPGALSDAVLDALLAQARKGVAVRVMLDAHGAQEAPRERFDALEQAGGKVVWFRPIRLGELSNLHKRNHRRAIVIDGEVGFTGGAAVADTWLGDGDGPEAWRDDLVRVTGPLAESVQYAFAQSWAANAGEVLSGRDFFPHTPPVPSDGHAITRHVNVTSSPNQGDHPVRVLFWMSFSAARERIWITNPYVIPDPSIREALIERARAGVDVRILTASEHTDLAPVRWASRHFYRPLLEAGVRIFEYQPSLIHSKNAVIDGVWSLSGSANLDVRSKELNDENVLGIQDRGFARSVEALFQHDLERADEILLQDWLERPGWQRIRGELAASLSEQL